MKTRSQSNKKFNILVYYRTLTNERINFPMPINFSWVGGGTDLTTGLRDWQIWGESGVGNAVEILSEFCINQVNFGNLHKDFKIEVYYN